MTINRRNFFGFTAGAGVAMPSIGRDIGKSIKEFDDVPTNLYHSTETDGSATRNTYWADAIKEAQEKAIDLANGKDDDEIRKRAEKNAREWIDVDLRASLSLSPAAMYSIQRDRNFVTEKKRKRLRISDMIKEYRSYMK